MFFLEARIRKFLVISLFFCQWIRGGQSLEDYFSYISQLDQDRGNYSTGEIEVVIDPLEISEIQKIQENRLLQKGFSAEKAAEFSRVGIVNEDQY